MLYFRKLAGQWVVYGEPTEVKEGPATVQKRNGSTTEVVIKSLGEMVRINGVICRIGIIDSDRPTYRERREAKAENLREWADKRETAAEATIKADEVYTSDYAFNTQPGHIPIREKVIARQDRAYESLRKAEEMAARADNIEAATRGAIYSDDPDAIEQLEAKIADLEAQRDRIKAYNASCRKGQRDVTLLDERQQEQLASTAKSAAYQIRDNGAAPAYWAQNIGGNITRLRKRLAQLKREKALLGESDDHGNNRSS